MRISNGMPEIGDISLAQLEVRDKDVNFAKPNQQIFPSEGLGMSVTPWDATITYPPLTANKPLWRISVARLQMHGLQVYQDVLTHALVVSLNHTNLENFRKRVHSTAPFWERY
jgi:hypothetical protein